MIFSDNLYKFGGYTTLQTCMLSIMGQVGKKSEDRKKYGQTLEMSKKLWPISDIGPKIGRR